MKQDMCKCTPNIRTPFCGKLGCQWPKQKESVRPPYNQIDHTHCFHEDNPPCGQRIEHLVCCLCGIPHPSINASIKSAREQERESCKNVIRKYQDDNLQDDDFLREWNLCLSLIVLIALNAQDFCEHEWIDATNEKVSGTKYCHKCGKLDSL